jgi:hypothetical protein
MAIEAKVVQMGVFSSLAAAGRARLDQLST